MDFVTEISNKNDINLRKISGISQINNEFYDMVVFEPVNSSGRLNNTSLNLFNEIIQKFQPKFVLPRKLHLNIVLIECEELVKQYRIPSNDPFMDFKVADHINSLSINHVQNIDLSVVKYRFLSGIRTIHTFDFKKTVENFRYKFPLSGGIRTIFVGFFRFLMLQLRQPNTVIASCRAKYGVYELILFIIHEQSSNFRTEFEIEIKQDGILSGLLYFFEMEYDDVTKLSTMSDLNENFEMSAFLLSSPKKIIKSEDECLSCELTIEDCLLNLSITE